MTQKEQFEKELSRITDIFFGARENFDYCYYLHKPKSRYEAEYLHVDRDLQFIRHSLWRMCIIELTQLFSNRENDKFNLLKFLSKLLPTGHYRRLAVNQEKIYEWQTMIYSQNHVINNIIILRDKIYAHTDPDKDQYKQIEVYFRDIVSLLEIVASIITDLHSSVLKRTLLLRNPVFDRNNFTLVRILAEERDRRVSEIKNLIKPHGG